MLRWDQPVVALMEFLGLVFSKHWWQIFGEQSRGPCWSQASPPHHPVSSEPCQVSVLVEDMEYFLGLHNEENSIFCIVG